jgi:hypothetical protein
VNDALEPRNGPCKSNDCVESSAEVSRQWNIPLSAFGSSEK